MTARCTGPRTSGWSRAAARRACWRPFTSTATIICCCEVRYSSSPIGRVPTQIDYSDYRSVAGGVKIPFKYTFSWLDGRDQFQLNDVKTNVAIDASKFARP